MSLPPPYEIDMHGLRPEAALKRLEQALHTARASGVTQVLAICGRGIGNRTGQPVLRNMIEKWARGPMGARSGVTSTQRTSKGGALLLTVR